MSHHRFKVTPFPSHAISGPTVLRFAGPFSFQDEEKGKNRMHHKINVVSKSCQSSESNFSSKCDLNKNGSAGSVFKLISFDSLEINK